MRRTGVRISVYWNFINHQILPELLQPLRNLGIQRVSPFYQQRVSPFFLWLCFIFSGEMSLSVRSSRSRVSVSLHVVVGDEDELEEDVEQ